jgi:hypothetical protein
MRILLAAIFSLIATAASATNVFFPSKGFSTSGASIGAGTNFSGANSVMFIANSATMNITAPFSVTMIINSTVANTTGPFVLMANSNPVGSNSGGGFDLRQNPGPNFSPLVGVVRGIGGGCGASLAPGPQACSRWNFVNDGNNHLVQFTFDGSCDTLYTDGILRDHACGLTYTPNTAVWQVGSSQINATITDLRLYSRVLSPYELIQQYRLMLAGFVPNSGTLTTGLIDYWAMGSPCPCTGSINGNVLQTDVNPPTAAITAPTGSGLTGNQTIVATCTDQVACKDVRLTVDGVTIANINAPGPYQGTWDTTTFLDGTHTVGCVARNTVLISANCSTQTVTTTNGVTAGDFYFSNSTGNDSNNCTTTGTPCKTIAKLNSLTYPSGSTIHFLEGDSWTGTTTAINLGGTGNGQGLTVNTYGNLTLTTYGGGTCAVIAGTTSGCAYISQSGYHSCIMLASVPGPITITNLRCQGDPAQLHLATGQCFLYGGTCTNGIADIVDNGGALNSQTITNNEFIDYTNGLNFQVLGGTQKGGANTISNNSVHGSTPTTEQDSGIVGTFVGANSIVQGNLVYNIGGHTGNQESDHIPGHCWFNGACGNGIEFSSCTSTLGACNLTIEDNVVHNTGGNTNGCGGPVGLWVYASSETTFQFNESYTAGPVTYSGGCDWNGFDIDGGSSDNLTQYNYSHDNFGAGYLVFVADLQSGQVWARNIWRYNISEHDVVANGNTSYHGGSVGFAGGGSNHTDSQFYNNTITAAYLDGNKSCFNWDINIDMVMANNICYLYGTNTTSPMIYGNSIPATATIHFDNRNNDYFYTSFSGVNRFTVQGTGYATLSDWQAGTGLDTGSINTNPNFSGSIPDGTCYTSGIPAGPQPCPTGVELSPGSPAIGTGIDLTLSPYFFDVGTVDYYGNTIPNGVGSGYNIGADGAHH